VLTLSQRQPGEHVVRASLGIDERHLSTTHCPEDTESMYAHYSEAIFSDQKCTESNISDTN